MSDITEEEAIAILKKKHWSKGELRVGLNLINIYIEDEDIQLQCEEGCVSVLPVEEIIKKGITKADILALNYLGWTVDDFNKKEWYLSCSI